MFQFGYCGFTLTWMLLEQSLLYALLHHVLVWSGMKASKYITSLVLNKEMLALGGAVQLVQLSFGCIREDLVVLGSEFYQGHVEVKSGAGQNLG